MRRIISINNNEDLRMAYRLVNYIDANKREVIDSIKREIRVYVKKSNERKIIRNHYDSWIEVIVLPNWIKSSKEAEWYFHDMIMMEYEPCEYDCTGQLFTRYHKIAERNGKFICYHFVCMDV